MLHGHHRPRAHRLLLPARRAPGTSLPRPYAELGPYTLRALGGATRAAGPHRAAVRADTGADDARLPRLSEAGPQGCSRATPSRARSIVPGAAPEAGEQLALLDEE